MAFFSENERFVLIAKLVPVTCVGLWCLADFAVMRRDFNLKVRGRFFMAAGGPAFRYKSSLRSGLTAVIRLKNKVGS
ncbi:hypothetical protein [Pedobacter sp. Leaf176]|uniref:hypothetical protein n=1 Tax=Pedobacter sp. Leaf176 TaxID=1736286 RepID=UPI0012F9934F|nr:hypothetical protein [Pedobacter sp. Leaf176]